MCQYWTAPGVRAGESASQGSRGAEEYGSEAALGGKTFSLSTSNYAAPSGSALSHNLWRHEINTCSPTINKGPFKLRHHLAFVMLLRAACRRTLYRRCAVLLSGVRPPKAAQSLISWAQRPEPQRCAKSGGKRFFVRLQHKRLPSNIHLHLILRHHPFSIY